MYIYIYFFFTFSNFCQGEAEVALSGDWHVPTRPEADDDQEAQTPEDGDLRHAYKYIYIHNAGFCWTPGHRVFAVDNSLLLI